MPNPKYDSYERAAPYFDLVRGALGDLVDGEHFFDIVADDVVYEVLYEIPGWPRIIKGRTDLMAAFRGYVDNVALQSGDRLIVHKTNDGRVVVIEYEVHGTILASGAKYDNRFCSIIKIENRKIVHWRDYMELARGLERIYGTHSLKDQPPETAGIDLHGPDPLGRGFAASFASGSSRRGRGRCCRACCRWACSRQALRAPQAPGRPGRRSDIPADAESRGGDRTPAPGFWHAPSVPR